MEGLATLKAKSGPVALRSTLPLFLWLIYLCALLPLLTSSEMPHPMPYVREDAHHFDLIDVLKTLHQKILNTYSHREKPRDGVRWPSHTMWATNSDIQNLAQ